MVKSKKYIQIMIVILLILVWSTIFFFNYKIYARDNYAYAASSYTTTKEIADQTVNGARYYMGKVGYRTGQHIDPSKQTLWENLYADVQIFLSHGDWDRITFKNTGILAGASQNWVGLDHIGTNDVHWDTDTILVTYMSCNGSKDNNPNGLAGKTANRGADIVVGFRQEINAYSAMLWCDAFMSALARGKGVQDAIDEANSPTYPVNNIKSATIWHHGNGNIKIGKYLNSVKNQNDESIKSRNILQSRRAIISNNIEEISNAIKNYDQTFDEDNFVITKTGGLNIIDVANNIVKDDEEIIDYQLKIGDYITNAGYSIKINNGIVTAIYDNTQILKSSGIDINTETNYFKTNLSSEQINLFKLNSLQKVKNNGNKSKVTEQEHKFYYDVNTGKKYVIVSTRIETQQPDGGKSIGIDEELYEI